MFVFIVSRENGISIDVIAGVNNYPSIISSVKLFGVAKNILWE